MPSFARSSYCDGRKTSHFTGEVWSVIQSIMKANCSSLCRPVQESTRDNSWSTVGGLGLGNSAWSTMPNTERPHIGSIYTTPGAQSVWSYNGPLNSVLPL